MNRRAFLAGLAATAAGLVLPPTLAENAEAARRYWALDRSMLGRHNEGHHLVSADEYLTTTISTADAWWFQPGDQIVIAESIDGPPYITYTPRRIIVVEHDA